MINEDLFNSISKEVREKLAECKTQDEIRKVFTAAGFEPLDDELLDAIAGGMRDPYFPQLCDKYNCRKNRP